MPGSRIRFSVAVAMPLMLTSGLAFAGGLPSALLGDATTAPSDDNACPPPSPGYPNPDPPNCGGKPPKNSKKSTTTSTSTSSTSTTTSSITTSSTTTSSTSTTSTSTTSTTLPGVPANPCASGGFSGATIAYRAYQGGLDRLPPPVVEEPAADGPVSGPVERNRDSAPPPFPIVLHEFACALDLLLGPPAPDA